MKKINHLINITTYLLFILNFSLFSCQKKELTQNIENATVKFKVTDIVSEENEEVSNKSSLNTQKK